MGIFTRSRPKVDPVVRLAELNEAGYEARSAETDRETRRIRHLVGVEAVKASPPKPELVKPAASPPPRGTESGCPEIDVADLTPELLRAAILDGGCLLVRGLVDEERSQEMADGIERAFSARLANRENRGKVDAEIYDELEAEPPYEVEKRDWVEQGGGVLAADSPKLFGDMLEVFSRAGLKEVIEGYLGETPVISANKCTLRKATPDVTGAWHQDGRFMGDVRAMNVWLSLSRCGDEAPGMDLVPTRLEDFVATGTEGTWLETQVSDAVAAEAAGEIGITRPVFNPGDALLFDELFLHQTGSDPEMTNPRYAIESWFFGPSAFPQDYVPIAF